MPVLRTHATVADFRRIGETHSLCELLEGCLLQEESPGFGHQSIQGALYAALYHHLAGRNAGCVLGQIDLYLSHDTVLQPDISYISQARRQIIANDRVNGPPDLVVEVLSSSTATRDLIQKRRLYRRFGVAEYWIVHPRAHTVTQLRFLPGGSVQEVAAGKGMALFSPLLPGLQIPVDPLFRPL